MNRRQFLYSGATSGITAVSGCLFGIGDRWGSNPNLNLVNKAESAARLEITVEREKFRDGGKEVTRTIVFDETVTVATGGRESLEVLGDGSFRITVRLDDQRLRFGTLPICDEAFTRVTVTGEKSLTATTRDCEGITYESTATPSAESGG